MDIHSVLFAKGLVLRRIPFNWNLMVSGFSLEIHSSSILQFMFCELSQWDNGAHSRAWSLILCVVLSFTTFLGWVLSPHSAVSLMAAATLPFQQGPGGGGGEG